MKTTFLDFEQPIAELEAQFFNFRFELGDGLLEIQKGGLHWFLILRLTGSAYSNRARPCPNRPKTIKSRNSIAPAHLPAHLQLTRLIVHPLDAAGLAVNVIEGN